jgi:purine catabolism regulator
VALAAQDAGVPALVGSLDDERVTLLIGDVKRLPALAAAIAERLRPVRAAIGVGPSVDGVREAASSLREAADVAAEVARAPLPERPFYQLADLRLRGLLRLLRDESELAGYVERELGPLRVYDDVHGTDLVGTLKTFLRCGYNKAGAAAAAHLSRPTLYQRLHQIEHVLGIDLEDNESRLALHVAALADDIVGN